VSRVDIPPVVREDVEDAKNKDKESGWPLGLEANSNHATGSKTEDRYNDTHDRPFALEDETQEEEDQQNASSK